MIHIYSCKDYSIHAHARTPQQANAILLAEPIHAGFCMFACDDMGRIVGDCEQGYTGYKSEMLPFHERSGNSMTGRES